MAYLNARGAYLKIDVVASSDMERSAQITNSSVASDITGNSITVVVKDDNKGKIGSYAQTITTAASGEWTFKIPKAAFYEQEGEEMSYEAYMTTAAGVEIPLMWGEIDIYEKV